MSGTLDLGGMTVSIDAGAIYLFQIVDSSSGHDGKIILEPGASIVFDDTAGAGFDSSIDEMSVVINGTQALPCSITSASVTPTNEWTMPSYATNLIAAYCTFLGYAGTVVVPSSWFVANCNIGSVPDSPYNISYWLSHVVVVESFASYGSRGAPVYGAIKAVPCYVSQKTVNAIGADGNEFTSDVQVLMDGTAVVALYDRITLPDGTKRPVRGLAPSMTPSGAVVSKAVFL